MRSGMVLVATAVIFGTAAQPAAAQTPDTRPGIAVLPFTNGGSFGADREDLEALQVGVQELLLTELAVNTNLRIVERSRMREILEEQGLAESGRVDGATAARVGKIVGARYMVTGVFMDNSGNFQMDARIIDVETSEILKAERVRDRKAKIYDLIVDLAAKITHDVKLPALASAEREARKSREVPAEAITLFSRAQVYQDRGNKERAVELYERIAQQFPDLSQAKEALQQIRGT